MRAFSKMSPSAQLDRAGYQTVGPSDSRVRMVVDANGTPLARLAHWEVYGWLAERGELPGPWTEWQAHQVDCYQAARQ